jgi:hypothetical protein
MNDRTAKFGILAVIMIPALVFLASCEIPQSARIKASPTLQIPVPLGEGTNNSFIRQYTDVGEIRERMKDQEEQGKVISIYEYNSADLMIHFGIEKPEGNNPVQTYLITYPLFDMSLDFDEYLNDTLLDTDKSRVPTVDISIGISNLVADRVNWAFQAGNSGGDDLPYSQWVDPFLGNSPEVDLGDMKSLLSDIAFNPNTSFSILIGNGDPDELQKAIRIRVPQLKIGGKLDTGEASWVKGVLNADRTELVFKSTGITPNDPLVLLSEGTPAEKEYSERIDVHVRLVNKIGAATYNSELNFDWYSVKVKPNDDDKQTSEFKGFNLGTYLTSLGDGVTFENVPAYLYVDTPAGIGGFTVEITGVGQGDDFTLAIDDIIPEKDKDGNSRDLPLWFNEAPSSKYDFTDTVNSGESINYKIVPPSAITLYSDKIDKKEKITANLAVLIPMVFNFTAGPGVEEIQINDDSGAGYYLPVKFQGLDDFLGQGDSSGSSGGNSVMNQIDEQLGEGSVHRLTLRLRDIDNRVTSDIYLAVPTDPEMKNPGPNDWEIVKIAADADDKDIDIKNVGSLTQLPRIKFFVKEEKGKGTGGMLYIQSQIDETEAAFSVKISVIAGINLDKPIDL